MTRTIAAWAAIFLFGCGGGREKNFVVAFSQTNHDPYHAAQNEMMLQLFAQQPGVTLVISDAEQDNSKQIAQVESFIRQKPDLLIVAPNDRAALTEVMGRAMKAKIPVICLERDILQPNYTTYIHSDHVVIGRMAGQFIVDQLKKKHGTARGNVVSIRGVPGVEGEIGRDRGAKEVFAQYPDIRIVAEPAAEWVQAAARDRMIEVLRTQPNIDAVYGHNDAMAVGAYLAARDLGREQEMFFVGVDGLNGVDGGIRKVKDRILAATFVYPLCVEKTVEIAGHMLREPGFKPEKEYLIESRMVVQ